MGHVCKINSGLYSRCGSADLTIFAHQQISQYSLISRSHNIHSSADLTIFTHQQITQYSFISRSHNIHSSADLTIFTHRQISQYSLISKSHNIHLSTDGRLINQNPSSRLWRGIKHRLETTDTKYKAQRNCTTDKDKTCEAYHVS